MHAPIQQWKIPTVTGNDSADSERPLCGCLKAIYVEYSGTSAAGTDVTITTAHSPSQTLLTLTDNNTSGWYYPRAQIDDDTGAAVTAEYDTFPISDHVRVTVAQNNADDTVDVTVILGR